MERLTKDQAAQELASAHFSVEPGLRQVFRLLAPAQVEADPKEPIKLLEINNSAVPLGIQPVFFGADEQTPFPSVVIDITPQEYEHILNGKLQLPNGWELGCEYDRPTAGIQG